MEDRHKKIRRKLYYLIPLIVFSGLLGILAIGGIATGGGAIIGVFLLAISVTGFVFSFIRIRSIVLDLQERPPEIEGILKRKRIEIPERAEQRTTYYLYIENLDLELRCGLKEWRIADEGDRVRIVYHQHSRFIESIVPLSKETSEEVDLFQHAWSKADGRCQCIEILHGHEAPCNKELNKDAYMKEWEGGWAECFMNSIQLGVYCWDCYNWKAEIDKRRMQNIPAT